MSAGVIMNFILAIFIFSHLTYHSGISEPDSSTTIGGIIAQYPAETLGLQSGDKIISVKDAISYIDNKSK